MCLKKRMGLKEDLPPVYKTPPSNQSIPITCLFFVLMGPENYLGVITTASLLPGETMVVWCFVVSGTFTEIRLLSDQRPWVINVGLFINGARRHLASEAAVVTSIWKVKSDPIGTICG